ncbi:MAG: glycosyltransferase [Bacteroidota bacterium]
MTIVWQLIFGICVLGLFHTYVFFPLLMRWLARGRSLNPERFSPDDQWPSVSVIMAVYNEEKVIREKMDSLLALDYPTDRLHIYVGSDCSTDQTNEILAEYDTRFSQVHIYPFHQRRGKPGQVNEIAADISTSHPPSADHLYLMTDASVILPPDCLRTMVRHFKNPDIVLVDANMLAKGLQAKGISRSEDQYVNREVRLKQWESLWSGQMIGPFGGCYVIRSDYFTPVPPNYLVDDFFICMKALEKGGKAINDLEARCYEGISHSISEEFRRKARISAGNFQNLRSFRHLANPFHSFLGFAFFSHKVLRWLGPFFIIFAFVSCLLLAVTGNKPYLYLLYLQGIALFVVPSLDWLSRKLNVNLLWLRSITYFLAMNAALLKGFFKYSKGIKTNVWQPTQRN